MISKPYKPFASIGKAKMHISFNNKKFERRNAFPCLACSGFGWNRDEKDRDPIEGYKLAPKYKCHACDGTGVGSKAAFMEWYDKRMAEYKKELEEYKRKIKRFKELQKIISREDMDIIREGLH